MWESGGIPTRILNFGTGYGWVVSFKSGLYSSGEGPWVPIVWEVGWVPEPIWTLWRKIKSLFLPPSLHTVSAIPPPARVEIWCEMGHNGADIRSIFNWDSDRWCCSFQQTETQEIAICPQVSPEMQPAQWDVDVFMGETRVRVFLYFSPKLDSADLTEFIYHK